MHLQSVDYSRGLCTDHLLTRVSPVSAGAAPVDARQRSGSLHSNPRSSTSNKGWFFYCEYPVCRSRSEIMKSFIIPLTKLSWRSWFRKTFFLNVASLAIIGVIACIVVAHRLPIYLSCLAESWHNTLWTVLCSNVPLDAEVSAPSP